MNSRVPPPSPPPHPDNATGRPVAIKIVAYYNGGLSRRTFDASAVVVEGGDTDVPALLMLAIQGIRDQGNFPADVTKIEVKAERPD